MVCTASEAGENRKIVAVVAGIVSVVSNILTEMFILISTLFFPEDKTWPLWELVS